MKLLTTIFALLLVAGVGHAYANVQNRHLSGFKGVNVGGSFDVYITQGSSESVKVDAPADIMDRVRTEVVDGVLKIYAKGGWSWGNMFKDAKVKVYVTARDLNSIGVSGSGNTYFKDGVTSNTLQLSVSGSGDMVGRVSAKELESHISGSGTMRISGRTVNSAVSVSGSGDFYGSDLITTHTAIRVSGSGDAAINASDKIEASVSGSGSIRYNGGAKDVSSSKSGSGSISRM